MHALLLFIDFFPVPSPPAMPKFKKSRSPSPDNFLFNDADVTTSLIASREGSPTTPPQMTRALENLTQTPGNRGTSSHLNYEEHHHRKSVDVYVDEDLQTSRVFFPTDIFLHVLLGLPKDWESDEPMQSLIDTVLRNAAYRKHRKAYKETCLQRIEHENQLYDDYLDMCNTATRIIVHEDGSDASKSLWSYRQDHNPLLGSMAKRLPDGMTISKELWKGSRNQMRTGKGPENPFGWPQGQLFVDLKPVLRALDRGSTCPYTVLGIDDMDPRDMRELLDAVERVEKRQGMSSDIGNHLRNAKKRASESTTDMRAAKRSKTQNSLSALAASGGLTLSSIDMQPVDDSKNRHSVSRQCARYALEVLSSAGFRSHSFGLLIGVNEIQILYYDRSIIAVSQPFQMVDLEVQPAKRVQCLDERRFIAVLICLQRATLAQRGIMENLMPDPFLEVYQDYTKDMAEDPKTLFIGRQITLQVGNQSVLVTLGRIVMRQPGIIGRNTCVVEGKSDAWPDKELVVKISWPAASRVPENTFVDEIKKAAEAQKSAAWVLDHIPTVLHSQDFPLLPDSPGSKLREYLSGPDVKFVDEAFDYELRVCRVSVHERLHRLEALTAPEDYARVLFDVVQVHRWIYDHPRILHRDLSQGNVMWHRRRGRICGVLNDFDLSSSRDATGASSKQRTGTRPFMARELHRLDVNRNPPIHLYRHDLESIFYIIVILTCASALSTELGDDGSYLQAIKSSPYRQWLSMTDAQLYDKKHAMISSFDALSIPVPHHSFGDFAPCLQQLHKQFATGIYKMLGASLFGTDGGSVCDNATLGGAVTYAAFMDIMKTFGGVDLEVLYSVSEKD